MVSAMGTNQSENPSGADNEQGSPTTTELAWLAGYIDGDGSICLTRSKRPNSRHLRYSARVTMTTTSPMLRDHLIALLGRIGVKPTVIGTKARRLNGYQHSAVWNINASSNIQAKKVLTAIRPYLIEKAHEADIVLVYLYWRSAQPTVPAGSRRGEIIEGMKERAEQTMAALREHRKLRRDPSTTTRLAPDSKSG
jgi:hypothetical protein